MKYISNTDLMNYNVFACVRHFIVRRIGSRMILGCLQGTTHTFPLASLWPNNSVTRLAGLGKPPVISHGKYSVFLQYNQQATAYYFIIIIIIVIIIIFEWNGGKSGDEGEHESRIEMTQSRTKRRKIPDTGMKHLTKENWEEKTKSERVTDRKELGLSRKTRDRIYVTSLFVLIWPN